ncbi:MAG: hypothetical protein ACXWZL_13350 [Mycobacterium sp.]
MTANRHASFEDLYFPGKTAESIASRGVVDFGSAWRRVVINESW